MAFDRMYVSESGVKGHEKLDAVMSKVKSTTSDANLKGVAQAAHPLVKAHLKVSRDMVAKMSGGSMNSGRWATKICQMIKPGPGTQVRSPAFL